MRKITKCQSTGNYKKLKIKLGRIFELPMAEYEFNLRSILCSILYQSGKPCSFNGRTTWCRPWSPCRSIGCWRCPSAEFWSKFGPLLAKSSKSSRNLQIGPSAVFVLCTYCNVYSKQSGEAVDLGTDISVRCGQFSVLQKIKSRMAKLNSTQSFTQWLLQKR